ncbi:MAG: UDP-N-acetylglucosamine diphosphorylase [Oscillospiraceae bacterium]|nr:UDP-N-acetylglucosamine diphosphorylase [Oscillospiraceae bacterium]
MTNDWQNEGGFFHMTNDQRHAIINRHIAAGVEIPCADGIIIDEHTTIGAGSTVYPGTMLRNCTVGSGVTLNHVQAQDCHIGDGCTLGPWVHLRPGTVLSAGVHVGNFVEIKNTQVGTGTKISHLSYLGDATVGERVNVGCGLAVANYGGQKGVKHRTTIEEGAFIGCNNAIVAPVTIGENAYTAAGSTITEDVPADALAIARARQVHKPR